MKKKVDTLENEIVYIMQNHLNVFIINRITFLILRL